MVEERKKIAGGGLHHSAMKWWSDGEKCDKYVKRRDARVTGDGIASIAFGVNAPLCTYKVVGDIRINFPGIDWFSFSTAVVDFWETPV